MFPIFAAVEDVYSAEDLILLKEIEKKFLDEFPPDSKTIFENPKFLRDKVRSIANSFGFEVAAQGLSLQCTHHDEGKGRTTARKKRQEGLSPSKLRQWKTNRCGCPFSINFARARTKRNSDAPEKSVKITKANFMHGGGCLPSQQQLVLDRKRSGTHDVTVKEETLKQLVNLVLKNKNIPARIMRNHMKPLYPAGFDITATDICNMKMKINHAVEKNQGSSLLTPTIKAYLTNHEKDSLQSSSLDAQDPEFLDLATKFASWCRQKQEVKASHRESQKEQEWRKKDSTCLQVLWNQRTLDVQQFHERLSHDQGLWKTASP